MQDKRVTHRWHRAHKWRSSFKDHDQEHIMGPQVDYCIVQVINLVLSYLITFLDKRTSFKDEDSSKVW